MRKVMTIVGTRPELIKMARVIAEFDSYTQHILVHTGQNFDYELNQIFFDDLGIRKPDYFLNAAGPNPAQTIARVIEKADEVLEKEQPEALMLYGDTNSCLAVISAKRRKIPVFHMEAGNRCFDQRVPEEINRKLIDHLSDINITLTEHARRYLIAEGLPPERIIKSGSHMEEVLSHFWPKIEKSSILTTLGVQARKYLLVSAHREENVDRPEKLTALLQALDLLTENYGVPIIMSTHPRTQKRLEELNKGGSTADLRFLKPFGFTDYIKLQKEAICTLSDSGTITEEASLLSLPAVNLRDAHERPEGMDQGTLIMSALSPNEILDAVRVTVSSHKRDLDAKHIVPDYKAGPVSKKILHIVLSYIDYINRVVWYK